MFASAICFALFALLLLPELAFSRARVLAAPKTASDPFQQYIFLNRAPEIDYSQSRPESIDDDDFSDVLAKVNRRGTAARRLGLSFILSYLNSSPQSVEASLRRLLSLSQKHDVPVLIVLDGQNWWDYRPDLWNWWDEKRPGFNPDNAKNVEWTGPSPKFAMKVAWRNWGRQLRVLPPPNLASPRFRAASTRELVRLAGIIKAWKDKLPREKRYLFPGVKIGWEASVGINAFYYPNGNAIFERFPSDESRDPQSGLDMNRDAFGGLVPIGYAALHTKGWNRAGREITLSDVEKITSDYLAFLSRICRQAGFARQEIWTHAGGQFAPWEKHLSHSVAINSDALPGWSFYGHLPGNAGDLSASLDAAKLQDWAAAEWLPNATTAIEWEAAFNQTLAFRRCRYVSLYNWEGIRDRSEAIEGLRRALNPPPTR